MKFALAGSVIALAAVASAQLDNIPSCALNCFLGPLGSDGCSALTDFKCHCQKGAELVAKVTPCVQGACSAADQSKAVAAVQKTCQDAGIPINVPTPGASSAASAASSAAASSAASAASSAASAASSKVASATSAAASAASSAAGAASSAASKVSSALASATGNGTAPTKPTATQFTGGASQATQAAALIGAAALAMLAL